MSPSLRRRIPGLVAVVVGLAIGALLSIANSRTLSAVADNLFLLLFGMGAGWGLTCGILLSRKLVAPTTWVGYSPLGCFLGGLGAALIFWSRVSAPGSRSWPLDTAGFILVFAGSLLHAHVRR